MQYILLKVRSGTLYITYYWTGDLEHYAIHIIEREIWNIIQYILLNERSWTSFWYYKCFYLQTKMQIVHENQKKRELLKTGLGLWVSLPVRDLNLSDWSVLKNFVSYQTLTLSLQDTGVNQILKSLKTC